MAASDRTVGVDHQTPGAEAHKIVELLRRDSHATFHLSCYELQVRLRLLYVQLGLFLHARLAYHERGAIVKQPRLRLSADVLRVSRAFSTVDPRSENHILTRNTLHTRSQVSADVR